MNKLAKALKAAAGNAGNPNAWDISKIYYNAGDGAWDLSRVHPHAAYLGVTAPNSAPTGIFFRDDGIKFYFSGTTTYERVYEYNLDWVDGSPTPWYLPAGTLAGNLVGYYDVSTAESVVEDLFFSPDGTKMYIVGSGGDEVNQYDLSTAWTISSASYTQNFSVAAQETQPTGIFFKPDGLKMFIVGKSIDSVCEYSLSTAWDISTASYIQNFSVTTEDTLPESLFFSSDGTKMYVMGDSGNDINQYTLSTAWDISTSSYTRNYSVAAKDTSPKGIFFKTDGSKFFVAGVATAQIYTYLIGDGFFNVSTEETTPEGLFFKPDGTKMYIIGSTGDEVNEYSLSTAWDISTSSYTQNYSVAAKESAPRGLCFSSDGTYMYHTGNSDFVHQYTLSTPWNISTASFTRSFNRAATAGTQCYDVQFKTDGTIMYVLSDTNDAVYQYTLSTAWNISTAGSPTSYSISSQDTDPRAIFFGDDGAKMYLSGAQNDSIYEYDLSTPWNVTTASYLQKYFVRPETSQLSGIFWNDDGTKFFGLGSASDPVVFSYGVSKE